MKTKITDLIGNTPILKYCENSEAAAIWVKLENANPGGSVKDRIAAAMLQAGKAKGLITEATIVIEATSGNTGIGLAMAAAAQNLPLTLVMPDTMSIERRQLLAAYGARLELTPGSKGMKGALERVSELVAENKNYWHVDQFSNPANPAIHYSQTGPELYQQLAGKIDALVLGVGTGGSLTGIGRYLRERIPELKIFAVEPSLSPVLAGGQGGPHPIQGIGAGFIPAVLDTSLIDQVIAVEAENAFATARKMARKLGVLAGISSGAAIWAATEVANTLGSDKNVVTLAPDTGERYLSTELFSQ
ncbi:MAG: cysteine synthase A [Firmicutes bacterium]|nr:cysteine synthase A [Bacillota bacterium]